jgi:hypothetical protein
MSVFRDRSLAALLLLAGSVSAETVGKIEFFGTEGRNAASVLAELPLKEGDPFPISDEKQSEALIQSVREAVTRATGRQPTDITAVCCDRGGNWMLT